jgi:dTMP kinase
VLDPDGQVTPRAEALIYAADRAHHVDTVIRPALEVGSIVLTDRYVDSTLAYQGAGRGLGADARIVTEWATGGLTPDLTVVLDLDPALGLARAGSRAGDWPGRLDRVESASMAFHQAVRARFLELAAESPERYVVLDAAADPEAIALSVAAALSRLLA